MSLPDLEECDEAIVKYGEHLINHTDDEDEEKRSSSSTKRYLQDIRWLEQYLDGDDPLEVTPQDAYAIGMALSEYNGSTGRYRWDRIDAMYDWHRRMGNININPCDKWDPKDDLSLTKSTEREAKGEEQYACTESDIRKMEQHVGRHRTRDQLLIRLIWQTGVRRGEASQIELDMIDREEREISLPGEITKNGNDRVVAYQPSLDHLLSEWLDRGLRAEMTQGKHNYLFSGERGGRLRGATINDIVRDAAIDAGINEPLYPDANAPDPDEEGEDENEEPDPNRWKITAHNVRHGYGSHLVNETDAGLWEVSKQMGHSSVKITEDIYVSHNPRAGIEHAHKYGPE